MKSKLGSGERFKKLSGSIASEYEKKGMSRKKAEAIAGATAAKIGRKKYGVARFNKLSHKGK